MQTSINFTRVAVLLAFTSLALIGGVYVTLYHASILGNFYQVRLFEIVSLTVKVFLVVLGAYYLRRHLSFNVKRRELLLGQIERYSNQIEKIYNYYCEHKKTLDQENLREIAFLFKDANRQLSLIIELLCKNKEHCKCTSDSQHLESLQLKFKSSLTDMLFNQQEDLFSPKEDPHTQYSNLTNRITRCRMMLFQ